MGETFTERFSAYVVIPESVYFDRNLSARAILLYGLISNMSNHKGYCWAKNETIARYLGLEEKNSDRTVRRLLAELKDTGYVRIEQCNIDGNTVRKIFLDKVFYHPGKLDVIQMGENITEQFGAYVVIPSPVFFDRNLHARAILLYGLISSMSNYKGYCWAKNETMAKYLGLDEDNSDRTVRRLLEKLKDNGYIRVDLSNTDGITVRKIFLDKVFNRPDKNVRQPGQKCPDRPDKNVRQNNIKNNNIPPIVPQGGQEHQNPKKPTKRRAPTGDVVMSPELEESFSRFYEAYPKKQARPIARLRWSQLEPDEDLVQIILQAVENQKCTSQWLDGYIPQPGKWLNDRRWEDEVTPAAKPEDTGRYL